MDQSINKFNHFNYIIYNLETSLENLQELTVDWESIEQIKFKKKVVIMDN